MKARLVSLVLIALMLCLLVPRTVRPTAAERHAVPTDCAPVPPSLISWWPGEGNTEDAWGSHNGSLNNGATFAPGLVGLSFSFDGIDDYVSVPDSPELRLSSFTIEAWVNFASIPTGAEYVIVRKGNYANYNFLSGYTTTELWMNFWNGNIYESELISQTSMNLAQWYHVATTFDSGSRNFSIYINGVLEDTEITEGIPATSSEYLSIGGRPFTAGVTTWDGLIDEVAIYDRALSAAEIQTIYDAGSAGKCKSVTLFVIDYSYRFTSGETGTGTFYLYADGSFSTETGYTGTWFYTPTQQRLTLQYDPGQICDARLVGRVNAAAGTVGGRVSCQDGSGRSGVWSGFITAGLAAGLPTESLGAPALTVPANMISQVGQ